MYRVPNIDFVTKHDICIGCGVCQNACPQNAITIDVRNGMFLPAVDNVRCNNIRGCHRCYDVCPGLGINLVDCAKQLYAGGDVFEDKFIGRYIQCHTGHSTNEEMRYHAASGGMLSQILIWLLETGKIDGAVVTRFDTSAPLKVKTFIATTKDDIIASRSSKYAPVTYSQVIREVKKATGSRYVFVGVPCQIEGVRKMMAKDQRLREKIAGLFAIYCSGTRTFYFTEYILKSRNIDIGNVDFLSYRDNGCLGGMVVKGKGIDYYEDYQSYSNPLRTIFYPRRCLLCADHFGELADICFGDIHIKPYSDDKIGINSLVVRSRYWNDMLNEACSAGVITLDTLDENTLLASQKMAKVKKTRNITFCMLNKKLGQPVPEYGTLYEAKLTCKDIINYFRMSVERYVGRHKLLWCVIPRIKSKVKIK